MKFIIINGKTPFDKAFEIIWKYQKDKAIVYAYSILMAWEYINPGNNFRFNNEITFWENVIVEIYRIDMKKNK